MHRVLFHCLLWICSSILAQQAPYHIFPTAELPYHRVRYESAGITGELAFPVNYTLWIPPGVRTLRGVIVHQHGCGEGSCKSGLTGAYDLHWQALAEKHRCALLSPAYEQPEKADCQLWCDPRNGSSDTFLKALSDLGRSSGHPELSRVPWALWGHSGGGHWAGGMVMMHPGRVVAAWLRSGVPLVVPTPDRSGIKTHAIPEASLEVPILCNLGTKEGFTDKTNRFAGVWTAVEVFFKTMRTKGARVGIAIDPLTSHECGNQRYLAIPWLDACLSARLPRRAGKLMNPMPETDAFLVPLSAPGAELVQPAPIRSFRGDPREAIWLPNKAVAAAWLQYSKDTAIEDHTPPPAPRRVVVRHNELTWEGRADLESGLAGFIIERDGRFLARVPSEARNPYGRPIFQNLQYSDTPPQPLAEMRYVDQTAEAGRKHRYKVRAVNTAGLISN